MKHKYSPTIVRKDLGDGGSYYMKINNYDINGNCVGEEYIPIPVDIHNTAEVRKWWARQWKDMGHTGIPERIKWSK